MGCYRVWANHRHVDIHGVSIGIERAGDSVILEPEDAKGPPELRLHGFLTGVQAVARLVPHPACPAETHFEEIAEVLYGSDETRGRTDSR